MAQFSNTATLTYNGSVINSNTTVGEIVEVLTVSKTAVNSNYKSGDTLTYVVTIINSGTTAFTGMTLNDDMGSYEVSGTAVYPLEFVDDSILYYINGVLQPSPGYVAGSDLTIENLTIPAGGNTTIVYNASITDTAPLSTGSSVQNTATIDGTSITTPVVATSTLGVSTEPQLSITKSLSPTTVNENGTITYTFTIENYGNTAIALTDDIILSDTFTPILSNITVTYNGTAWSVTTNYTYDTTTGAFASVAGNIAVPAATYTQDTTTGIITVTPGVSTVTVTGTI